MSCFPRLCEYIKSQYSKVELLKDGGGIRLLRGITCETMVDIICESLNIESRVGSSDFQLITITGRDGKEYSTRHQVDRHLYYNNKIIAVVECKSYLDSCYYTRACSDFKRMSVLHPNIKKYIFALENNISDSTIAFTDVEFDYVCNDIFYMCNGKRKSKKPIYEKDFSKELVYENVERFINELKTNL